MDTTALRTRLRPDEKWEEGEPLLPHVVDMETMKGHRLRLLFSNGEERIYDVTPLIGRGVFIPLQDPAVFGEAWIEAGSVEWPSGAGLSSDTLFLDSVLVPAEDQP